MLLHYSAADRANTEFLPNMQIFILRSDKVAVKAVDFGILDVLDPYTEPASLILSYFASRLHFLSHSILHVYIDSLLYLYSHHLIG